MGIVNYPNTSPYASTPQTSWYLAQYVHRDIPADSTDTLLPPLPPRYHNRPDRLSFDLYKTPHYWWVFMVRNLDIVRDPIWDFVTGIQLFVPSLTRLNNLLG